MKTNKTEIVIVLDRSGSMDTIKDDIKGGFKTFLENQKKLDGECFVTLVQFDDQYEEIYKNKSLKEINEIQLEPRGWTALLDAIGKTINSVGNRLRDTKEEDRPSQVLFMILSDGAENSSCEFNHQKIKEMIEHQTNKYSWKFTFMGCSGFDAVKTGGSYGVAGSSLNFAISSSGIANAFSAVSNATSFYRCSTDLSAAYSYTQEERDAAADVNNKTTTTNKTPTVKIK